MGIHNKHCPKMMHSEYVRFETLILEKASLAQSVQSEG